MTPKIDIVSQQNASQYKLLFGFQIGLFGFVIRIGLYNWIIRTTLNYSIIKFSVSTTYYDIIFSNIYNMIYSIFVYTTKSFIIRE
jgi:hypothetical protein